LSDKEFKVWVARSPRQSEAKCKLCLKIFDISAMGVGALKSHMKSKKHTEAVKGAGQPGSSTQLGLFQRDASAAGNQR
jgi:hypothetical protein